MITDAQYQAWLEADNRQRVVLCEAEYSGGTEYFSTAGYVSGPSDSPANISYDDLLATIPEITSRIDTSAAVGDIEVLNMGGGLDSWLTRAWAGRPIRLYFGDPSWSRDDFRKIYDGLISELTAPSQSALAFVVADKADLFSDPISDTLYEGDTHPAAGTGAPRVYGDVFNVTPTLIDADTRTYQVSDGALTAISAVRAGGVSVGYTAQLSAGTFTLDSAASGSITCDATAAINTAAGIIDDIVTGSGKITAAEIDAASFAAFSTAPLGLYIRDTNERGIDQALDLITETFWGYWRFDRSGLLKLHRLVLPTTASQSFIADDVRQTSPGVSSLRLSTNERPVWRHTLGYRRNWTVQGQITEEKPTRKEFYRPIITIWGILLRQHGRAWAEAWRANVKASWAARAELAPAVADAERSEYGDEWQRVIAEDATIKDTWPKAEDRDIDGTLFVAESDAQAEADRRLAIRSTVRRVYSMDMTTVPFSVGVGDEVSFTHPRYGFGAGPPVLVTGISEQPTKGFVALDIWL